MSASRTRAALPDVEWLADASAETLSARFAACEVRAATTIVIWPNSAKTHGLRVQDVGNWLSCRRKLTLYVSGMSAAMSEAMYQEMVVRAQGGSAHRRQRTRAEGARTLLLFRVRLVFYFSK